MFIKYEKVLDKKVFEKKIGIKPFGRIVFYKETAKDLECDYVNLFFDAETNRIGIKPTYCPAGAFKIQGNLTKFINAKRFFNRFNIHPEGRFDYTVEDGMLVVQLGGEI